MSVVNKFAALPSQKRLPKGREWVYFLRADCPDGLVKIGHSTNLKWRLLGIQTQCPVQLSLVGLVDAPAGTELVLHAALATSRSHGEWFRPSPEIDRIRARLPKAGRIETPELVKLVEPLGVSELVARSLLLRGLTHAKHMDAESDDSYEMLQAKRRDDYDVAYLTSETFRKSLKDRM